MIDEQALMPELIENKTLAWLRDGPWAYQYVDNEAEYQRLVVLAVFG